MSLTASYWRGSRVAVTKTPARLSARRYALWSARNSSMRQSLPRCERRLMKATAAGLPRETLLIRSESASEVVRAALRTLEREELQYEAKLAALRTAIDEGDGSGVAEGNPFDRVRQALKLREKKR